MRTCEKKGTGTFCAEAPSGFYRTKGSCPLFLAVLVAVTAGRLDFGPWEQIFYGEFDGRRRKRVLVKIIGD